MSVCWKASGQGGGGGRRSNNINESVGKMDEVKWTLVDLSEQKMKQDSYVGGCRVGY